MKDKKARQEIGQLIAELKHHDDIVIYDCPKCKHKTLMWRKDNFHDDFYVRQGEHLRSQFIIYSCLTCGSKFQKAKGLVEVPQEKK